MKSEGFFVVEGADNLVGKVGIRCEEEVLWSLHNKSIKGKYLFLLIIVEPYQFLSFIIKNKDRAKRSQSIDFQ